VQKSSFPLVHTRELFIRYGHKGPWHFLEQVVGNGNVLRRDVPSLPEGGGGSRNPARRVVQVQVRGPTKPLLNRSSGEDERESVRRESGAWTCTVGHGVAGGIFDGCGCRGGLAAWELTQLADDA
jgi:hypothetical protein